MSYPHFSTDCHEYHPQLSVNLSQFSIVTDDGYTELRQFLDEDDVEGEFVAFVDSGDSLAELVETARRYYPEGERP